VCTENLNPDNIPKQVSPTNTADSGAKFDAFAMRTQVAF
jgi:hypothetical protein